MDWEVVFSLRSREDLRKIVTHIATDSPADAERFGLALIAQAESLANAPRIGMPMPERPGARLLPFGSYLIIYRPDSIRKAVRILRFWHAARRRRPLR
ncbi:MAG: type II toxin-antitoxin system RelE/ParE family toxin [Chthoniobacter sp.]